MGVTRGPKYPGTSDGLIFSFDPKNRECWKGGTTSTVYGLGPLNATGSMNFDSDAGEFDGANTTEGYFTFDGASDYVPFESKISSHLTYGASWSIGCWVYVTGNWNCAWSNVISGTRGVYVRETNGNAWEFWIYEDGSNYKTVTSTSFPQNQWVSAICTYGGSGNMNVYINGVVDNDSTSTVGSPSDITSSEPFNFGRHSASTAYWFTGNLGPLTIWNKELTASEVLTNHNRLKGRFGL